MPGFDGTGPNGMGPMTGGGRGFCSTRGASVRNYAFTRWTPYAYPRYGAYGFNPFSPNMSQTFDAFISLELATQKSV